MKKISFSLTILAASLVMAQIQPSSIYMLKTEKTKVNQSNVGQFTQKSQSILVKMKEIRSTPKVNQLFKDLSKLLRDEVSIYTYPQADGFWIGVGDNLETPAPLNRKVMHSADELITILEQAIKHYSN